MKKKQNGGRPGPQPLQIKRHYSTLTPKETDELVDSVAELIVNYVKTKGGDPPETPDPGPVEKPDPEQPQTDVPTKRKRKGRR